MTLHIHSSKLFNCLRNFSFPIVCSVALFPAHVLAQVNPDGTLPTTVEQLEEIMRINGGQQEGNNLFHSFEEFSIPEGMEAIFENSTDIENIFTRITGDDISNINGILSTQGNANLFFINPNGIIFGENAQLNVGGSFLASTGKSIEFDDGTVFSATNPNNPLLTVSFPVGLGLGSNSGAITVNGSGHQIVKENDLLPYKIIQNKSRLSVSSGETLALVGNGINLNGGSLTAKSGRVELASVGSGSVNFQSLEGGWSFDYDNISAFNSVELTQKASINDSSFIQVHGSDVKLSNESLILFQDTGENISGNINIFATQSMNISGAAPDKIPSSIGSEIINQGNGADINIFTKNLILQEGTRIISGTFGTGKGGDININASDSARLFRTTEKLIEGKQSVIGTLTTSSGDSGSISLSAPNFESSNGAVVGSSTFGAGKGGDIDINSTSMALDGTTERDSLVTTIGSTAFNTGDSGNVNINTSVLKLIKRASISTDSKSSGNSGNLSINASNQIELAGIEPKTKKSSFITASVASEKDVNFKALLNLPDVPTGNAGNVAINTPSLKLSQRGTIRVENQGTGNAGTLSIDAKDIDLDDTGSITAAAASGEGGNIVINTRNLTAKKNSNVTTNAGGEGNGGNIQINADVLTGLENSDITANAIAGNGGNIVIKSGYLFGLSSTTKLTPFSDITASSELGIDGTVKIFSPESNIGEEIIIVGRDERVLKERDLVDDKCTDINQQRVRVQDLGSPIAPSPFDFPYSEDLPEPTPIANSSAPDDEQIIQANTVKVLPDGRTFLVAETKSNLPITQPQLCTRE
jgi:filamentous hemagglutinin family protein